MVRVHIQRVSQASVLINKVETGKIGQGLVLLVAAHEADCEKSMDRIADKCMNLRIFSDEAGKMNRSVKEINGDLLVISNFTLYGDCRKGNRPNFMEAAPGPIAERFYNRFVELLRDRGANAVTGRFGAMMDISLVNDGPVTLMLEG